MKDFLRQLLNPVENQILARQVTREYLQALLLQSLQDRGAFSTWLFQGGTALRYLYSAPRFSEDLDFALIEPGVEDTLGSLSWVGSSLWIHGILSFGHCPFTIG